MLQPGSGEKEQMTGSSVPPQAKPALLKAKIYLSMGRVV